MTVVKQNLSVALLLDDLVEAKKISKTFRKMGIIPHFFETLSEFYKAAFDNAPDLLLVDVKMMSEGNISLLNHPVVKSEDLSLVFYYSAETRPLLSSTHSLYHFGLIEKSESYEGILKTTLNRINQEKTLKRKLQSQEKEITYLQRKVGMLVGKLQDHKEKIEFDRVAKDLVVELQEKTPKQGFVDALVDVFSHWHAVEQMSLYQLSDNKQRLITAKAFSYKFKELPPLWPGKTCFSGIEFFVEKMVKQVARDMMGDDLVYLRVLGSYQNAEQLLILKLEPEYIPHFNWAQLEKELSLLYRGDVLLRQDAKRALGEKELSMGRLNANVWEFAGQLDALQQNDTATKHVLLDLNFANLNQTVLEQKMVSFAWNIFQRDFLFQIQRVLGKSLTEFVTMTSWGTEHLSFLLKEEDLPPLYEALKRVGPRFPYWRYFSDSIMVLDLDLSPKLKSISVDSKSYLRHIAESRQDINTVISRVAKKASKILVQNPPSISM